MKFMKWFPNAGLIVWNVISRKARNSVYNARNIFDFRRIDDYCYLLLVDVM